MRPVSAAFMAALRGGHGQLTRVRVLTTYQSGTQPSGTELLVDDGSVTASAKAEVRGTCDITVLSQWPELATDLLTPYGNELYVERGLAFGNGSVEWVGLGYYRIDSVHDARHPVGALRILGSDRMAGIRDSRLVAPRQFSAGTTAGDVVTSTVTEVYPSASIEWDDGTDAAILTRSLVVDRERHQFLDALASSYGKIMYWDHRGVLVIKTPPDPTEPVWDVDAGENGVLVSLSREINRAAVYNGAVVLGEGADTTEPVRALAIDNHPTSPTYWHGRYGKVPYFFSSPFVATDGQASNAAERLLQRTLGRPYNLSLGMIPNFALEPFDPVRVRTRDAARVHVLDDLQYPLTVRAMMTGTSRMQVNTEIGIIS
jgi:hypothetical protein